MTDKAKDVTNDKSETAKAVEKAPKDIKNGVTRPRADSKTGMVWAIADALSKKAKAPAGRKAVLDAATEEEINPSTAATQYGRWRKYNGLAGTGREVEAKEEVTPTKAK